MKKKIKTNPLVKEESSSTLQGNVDIKLVKKGKIFKHTKVNNHATLLLLQGMANYLSKYPTDRYIPQFAGVGYIASSSISTNIDRYSLDGEYLGKRVPINVLSTSVLAGNTGYQAKYQAIFTYNLLADNPVNQLGLFNTGDTNDTLLAETHLTSDLTLAPGVSLIIEWTINIKNADTTNVGGN